MPQLALASSVPHVGKVFAQPSGLQLGLIPGEGSGGSDRPGFCSAARAPPALTSGKALPRTGPNALAPGQGITLCSVFGSPRKPRWKLGEDSGAKSQPDAHPRLEGLIRAGSRPSYSRRGNLGWQNDIPWVHPSSCFAQILLPVLGHRFPIKRCPHTSPLLFRELPRPIPLRECRLLAGACPGLSSLPGDSCPLCQNPFFLKLLLFSAIF